MVMAAKKQRRPPTPNNGHHASNFGSGLPHVPGMKSQHEVFRASRNGPKARGTGVTGHTEFGKVRKDRRTLGG